LQQVIELGDPCVSRRIWLPDCCTEQRPAGAPATLHSGPMPDERDELIAALQQLTAFIEGLLTLNERLVRACDTDPRPSPEELAAMRDGVRRWREQLEGFKQRRAATVLGERPLPLQ